MPEGFGNSVWVEPAIFVKTCGLQLWFVSYSYPTHEYGKDGIYISDDFKMLNRFLF